MELINPQTLTKITLPTIEDLLTYQETLNPQNNPLIISLKSNQLLQKITLKQLNQIFENKMEIQLTLEKTFSEEDQKNLQKKCS